MTSTPGDYIQTPMAVSSSSPVLRARLYFRVLASMLHYFVRDIIRAHYEVILLPLLSSLLVLTIIPIGLKAFMSYHVASVIISGLLLVVFTAPSLISAFYVIIEFNLESFERYLLLPVPHYLVITTRLLASGLISSSVVILVMPLARLHGLMLDALDLAIVFLACILTSMGITGLAILVTEPSKSIQGKSLMISLLGIVVTYFSPFLFPLDVLPLAIQVLFLLNPLTHAIELLRLIADGYLGAALPVYAFARLLLINTFWLTMGVYLFERKLRKR